MDQFYIGNLGDIRMSVKTTKDIKKEEMDEIFYKFFVSLLSTEEVKISEKNFYYYNENDFEKMEQNKLKNTKILKCYIDDEIYAEFKTPGNSLLKKLLREVIETEPKNLEDYKKIYGLNIKEIEDGENRGSFKSHIKNNLYYQNVNISTLLKCLVKICNFHFKRIEICLINKEGVFYIKNF